MSQPANIVNTSLRAKCVLALVTLAFALPIFLAAYFFRHPERLSPGSTNKGELIVPIVKVSALSFEEFNPLSQPSTLETHQGKWILLFNTPKDCTGCQQQLDELERIWLALGKKREKITPLVIAPKSAHSEATQASIKRHFPDVQYAVAEERELKWLKRQLPSSTIDSQLFVIDPMGNLVMAYHPHNTAREILTDLKKLLRG